MNIVVELRQIANDLENEIRIADAQIENRLQEIKRQFIESFKKSPLLNKFDAEDAWEKIRDSIKYDLLKHPRDWTASGGS
jgi:hypothetical protein